MSSVEADGDYWLVAAESDVRAAIADALHDAGCAITHLRAVSAELDAIYRRYFLPELHEAAAATAGEGMS